MIVVINSLDSVVGHKVAVIEEETIETDTVSKLEVIIYRPVILSVNTCSVESYTGSRVLLTIITISHADYLRSCSVQEVIEAHRKIYKQIRAAKDKRFMTDALPHLLLYLAGIETPTYKEEYNILSPKYNEMRPRILKNSVDYDKLRDEYYKKQEKKGAKK